MLDPREVRRPRARHADLPRRARGDRDRRRVGGGDDERAQLAAHADDPALGNRRAERAFPQADGARRDARRVRALGARGGIGRRVAPHAGRARRRRLDAQRHQGVGVERHARATSSSPWRAPTRPTTAAGARGIGAFIITPDLPGFSVGKKEDKMGLRASPTVQLHFSDMRVPGDRPPRRRRAVDSSTRCSRSTTDGSASPRRRSASPRRRCAHAAALRGGAQAVRQADQGIPGDSVQARRHGDARRRRARAAARGGHGQGSRRAHDAVQRDGQAVRQRDGHVGHHPGDSDLRRLRLRQGLSRRAPVPRRQSHGDLRRHVGDPAHRDRAGAVLASSG